MKTLAEMQAEVEAFERHKGWYHMQVSFPERIALLHSEVSEALEAWRDWGVEDATGTAVDLGAGERTPKPEGVGSEFADILIRLLGDCRRAGIDLEAEYDRKMAFNWTREWRHGGKKI